MTTNPERRCYHRRDDGTACSLRREDHDQPGADHAAVDEPTERAS